MIRRVFIKGYKSLRDVDLTLSPLTVIIGPNASGKSNLLDGLALLSGMVTSSTINAAFDRHRGLPLESFFVPPGGLEELMRNETLRFSLGVDVELSPETQQQTEKLIRDMREGVPSGVESNGHRTRNRRITESYLRYEMEIEFYLPTGQLRVANERLVALRSDGNPKQSRKPFLERDYENYRLVLRMEGQAHPTYHELGLDHTIVSTALYPPHYPHLTAFREELGRWRFYYFDPGIMRQESALKAVTRLGADGADLSSYFHTLKNDSPDEFASVSRSLSMIIPAAESIDTELSREGLIRLTYRDSGTTYSSRVISDGTLRVLGLFAILGRSNGASTIGFEEPENGVHPRRLRLIARLLNTSAFTPVGSQKQIIVTTHSAQLPELLNPDYSANDPSSGASLIQCLKEDSETRFRPLISDPLLVSQDSEYALSEALLRGDFGG